METAKDEKSPELRRIGKYDVLEVLGRGGMGVVYRAIDKQLGREVAIKTLTQGVAGDPEMLTRFYEEGRKTGRLKHPHIVTVYDLGEENGIPYIVMERVEGDPLDKLIRGDSPLSTIDRLRIMEEVCSALGYAHNNNLIHRDVKPANIFVQPDGKAKLLDFGIARLESRTQELGLTRAGHIIGTIPYMAPERLSGKAIDGRSDIFSVGVVLHQLITGSLPFSGEDYVLMQKIINEPHPALSTLAAGCPSGLEAIIDKSLAKSVDDRYQSADEMAADLASLIEELRQAQIVEMLPEARRLIEADDLTRARTVLQKLLKVQNKNTEAKELLSEIHRRLSQRQRDERIHQVRQQAEDALSQKNFDLSLSILKEGLEIDSSNSGLLVLREQIQEEKKKQEQIDRYLSQSEAARRKGDYKAAIASAQEALKVDKTNSKIIVLCNFLASEAEQAQKKAQAKTLLDSVRRQIDARYFEKAIDLLRKVEELDPSEPEVQLLMGDANAGLEQNRRQELIARLEEKVSLATTLQQFQECADSIQEAMTAMPAESTLFRLSAQVDRRLKELKNKRLVEDTYQTCRDLGPRDALEVVRKARQRLPGDERLLSLESLLNERLQRQSVEEQRAEFLSRARVALKDSNFTAAVQILESCQAARIANTEVAAMLEFAHTEEAEQRRKQVLQTQLEKAQSLFNERSYDEAIEFLGEALDRSEDSALRLLLERAVSARDAIHEETKAALATAGKLVQARRIDEARDALSSLPPEVLRSSSIQTAIAAIEDELKSSLFRMAGRAYGLLDSDLSAGHAIMHRVAAASADSSSTATVAIAFLRRGQATADRALADAVSQSESLARTREKSALDALVQRAECVAEFASPQAKSNWQAQLARINKKGSTGRIRVDK